MFPSHFARVLFDRECAASRVAAGAPVTVRALERNAIAEPIAEPQPPPSSERRTVQVGGVAVPEGDGAALGRRGGRCPTWDGGRRPRAEPRPGLAARRRCAIADLSRRRLRASPRPSSLEQRADGPSEPEPLPSTALPDGAVASGPGADGPASGLTTPLLKRAPDRKARSRPRRLRPPRRRPFPQPHRRRLPMR